MDTNGNLYLAGDFSSSINFDNYTLSSVGYQDIFIAKLNNQGNTIWAHRGGGPGNSDKVGNLCLDNNGSCFLTGCFNQTSNFGSITLNALSNEDLYLVKYNINGDPIWGISSNGPARGLDLECDLSGNCIVGGNIVAGVVNFSGNIIDANGKILPVILKYSPNGNLLYMINGNTTWSAGIHHLSIDNQNNLHVAGEFNVDIDFGSNSLHGYYQIFTAVFDENGSQKYLIQSKRNDLIGGETWNTGIIALDDESSIVTGGYYKEVTFNNTILTANQQSQGWNGYIAKIGSENQYLEIISTVSSSCFVYPNPNSGEFMFRYQIQCNSSSLQIFDLLGRKVTEVIITNSEGTIPINATNILNGIYTWKIIPNCYSNTIEQGKVVIMR